MSNKTHEDRHPIRFMIRILVLAGLIGFAVKTVSAKKKEFHGLNESQARKKFAEKLGPKIGEDRANEVADQVIPRLKERGLVVEDPAPADIDDVDDLKAGGGSDTDSDE